MIGRKSSPEIVAYFTMRSRDVVAAEQYITRNVFLIHLIALLMPKDVRFSAKAQCEKEGPENGTFQLG